MFHGFSIKLVSRTWPSNRDKLTWPANRFNICSITLHLNSIFDFLHIWSITAGVVNTKWFHHLFQPQPFPPLWVDCMENWPPDSQGREGESWGEITASLPASTLSWLATAVSNTDSSNSDMSRVFTAVSRIAFSFSLKNTNVNMDMVQLVVHDVQQHLEAQLWPPPHLFHHGFCHHHTGHCDAPLTVSR